MVKGSSVLMTAMVLVALMLVMTIPGLSEALESVRCGTKLVQVGDSKASVLRKCGTPTTKWYNTWTYNRGPGKFMAVIKFSGDRVTATQHTEYGFVQPIVNPALSRGMMEK